jgi:hypothetical protein
VTGVQNNRDGDAVAELVLHLVAFVRRLERVVRGLQIEQRRAARGPPIGLLHRRHRGALRVAHDGMPAIEPTARIIAGREERKAQGLEPVIGRL